MTRGAAPAVQAPKGGEADGQQGAQDAAAAGAGRMRARMAEWVHFIAGGGLARVAAAAARKGVRHLCVRGSFFDEGEAATLRLPDGHAVQVYWL